MIIGLAIRVVGYVLSSVLAWFIYLGCIAAEFRDPGDSQTHLVAALIVCIFGGFSSALMLMAFPWTVVVWMYRKVRLFGPAYFGCSGLLLMILIGCAASSLSPKPLFIEDQTFLQGVLICLERQGLYLALAGLIVGLGYWFLGERNVTVEYHARRTAG